MEDSRSSGSMERRSPGPLASFALPIRPDPSACSATNCANWSMTGCRPYTVCLRAVFTADGDWSVLECPNAQICTRQPPQRVRGIKGNTTCAMKCIQGAIQSKTPTSRALPRAAIFLQMVDHAEMCTLFIVGIRLSREVTWCSARSSQPTTPLLGWSTGTAVWCIDPRAPLQCCLLLGFEVSVVYSSITMLLQ